MEHRLKRRAMLAATAGSLAMAASGCMVERVRPVSATEALRALEAARSRLGNPYAWGGQAPGGFDCSGLVLWAYQQALGVLRLRRRDGRIVSDATMEEIRSAYSLRLGPDEAWPGDILFVSDGSGIATHGGLVESVGDDEVRFVNASSHWQRVVSDVWPLTGSHRGQYVLGFGRLLVATRGLFGLADALPLPVVAPERRGGP